MRSANSVIDYETPPATARRTWQPDLILAGVLFLMLCANAFMAVVQWPDYYVFGLFAVAWLGFGLVSVVAGFAGCRWGSAIASLFVSAAAFYANAYYLGEITASC